MAALFHVTRRTWASWAKVVMMPCSLELKFVGAALYSIVINNNVIQAILRSYTLPSIINSVCLDIFPFF